MRDITLALQAVERGERHSSEELLPLVYNELRRLAAARMASQAAGQTLQPTDLVHEAWVRLMQNEATGWQNRAHFFGAASEAMRRILIERARRKMKVKHGGGRVRVNIEDFDIAQPLPDDSLLLLDEALKALEAKDPQIAQVVVLKFFGGLTNEEIVEVTGTSDRTVRRQWTYANAWLFNHISKQR